MKLTEGEAKRLARSIGFGHACVKHTSNVSGAGELLTQSSFESPILETLLNSGKMRQLQNVRIVFWKADESFLVVVNPADPDLGTAYWPEGGIHGYNIVR